MDELKLAFASNLIQLRTNAGMTQLELGEKLNYSDKSVSKWERAESLPDVYVLTQLAQLFGVSVDYLIRSHDEWVPPADDDKEYHRKLSLYSGITALTLCAILAVVFVVFTIFWILGTVEWYIFVYALPVILVTWLVLNSIWHKGRGNCYITMALVMSIAAVIYASLAKYHPWQIFLAVVPVELLVFLSFRIDKLRKL